MAQLVCNAGDLGLIPGLGRSPEKGEGYPLQYSGLENSTDCVVCGVAKSRTRLSGSHERGRFVVVFACNVLSGFATREMLAS